MAMRALIVDEEAAAREKIRQALCDESDIEIIGECGDDVETLAFIDNHEPDLVFLETRTPKLDGFEVLKKIKPEAVPLVIFITAHQRFAVEAFEIQAIDYLVKPFRRKRLQIAVGRARAQFENRQNGFLDKRFRSILHDFVAGKNYPGKIMLKTAKGISFINTSEIEWVEAAGNYVKIHAGKSAHLLRETMNNLEAKLDPDRFLRIHRSSLVNIDRIKELQPLFNGDYIVILRDDTELNLSRNYNDRLQRLFDKFS